MKVCAVTEIGKVRTKNEDSYLVDTDRAVFAVCDGMGGHRGGDVASSLAVKAIHDWIKQHPPGKSVMPLEKALQQANRIVWEKAQAHPDLRDMGTTATAALIWENHLYMSHVGDSSLFLIREGHIEKLSRDHTLAEQMVGKGLLNAEEARCSAYNHILTRAIGISPEVAIDNRQVPILAGDLITICSDGLTDLLTPLDMLDVYRIYKHDPDKIAGEMVRKALIRGGYDNITLIILPID